MWFVYEGVERQRIVLGLCRTCFRDSGEMCCKVVTAEFTKDQL